MNKTLVPAIVSLSDAKLLRAFGDEVVIHLSGDKTGGKFCLFTSITPPGGGPPPHHHENEDEWFMPLEGEIEFFSNGKWQAMESGTVIFMPRGPVHTFRNVGNTTSRLLTQTIPSGFETFFEKCAVAFGKSTEPDMDQIKKIAADHGIYFAQPNGNAPE